MKEGKAEYFVAVDIETKEETYVKVIPPQPEGDDLGGITEEEKKKIYKNEEDLGNKITKFYASNQGETHITDSDNGKIMNMLLFGKSSQDEIPTLENSVEVKCVVNPTVKVTNEDNVKVQSVTFNDITLYSVPVKDGGNITINGQKYIADYIDIENRKIVKFVKKMFIKQTRWSKAVNNGVFRFYSGVDDAFGIGGNKVIKNSFAISSHFVFFK